MTSRTVALLFVVSLSPLLALGQSDLRITGSYQNERLDVVLEDLMSRYPITINFSPERVKQHRVSTRFRNAPLAKALEEILAAVPFRFVISGQTKVLIVPDPKKDLAPPPSRITNLRGRISDSETGEPLPNATVGIVSTNRGTSANAEGFFALPELAEDSVEIEIRYLGYKPIRLLVTDSLDLASLDITLTPSTTVLDGILIEEQQSAIQLTEQAGVARLDPKKVEVLPNLGQPDMFQALQMIPGISATQGTSANLQVRGGTPDQNLILIDDIPLYHLDHFSGVYSTINPLSVQSLKVYKGGYPATFDGRSSSVIDIKSRGGNRKEATINGNVNLLSANLAVDVPIGNKLTWTATGRVAYNDLLATPLYDRLAQQYQNNIAAVEGSYVNLLPDDNADFFTDFDFYDVLTKLSYYPTQKDVISGSLMLSGDWVNVQLESAGTEANFRYDYLNRQETNWGNNGLSLSWGRQWNEHWYTKMLVTTSQYSNNTRQVEDVRVQTRIRGEDVFRDSITFREGNSLADGQIKLAFTYQPNSKHTMDFGVLVNGMSTRYFEVWSELDSIQVQEQFLTEAGRFSWYFQDTWALTPSTRLILGLRRNRYNPGDTSAAYWAPRLSVEQSLGEKITFKGAAGIYQQFIHQVSSNRFQANNRFSWALANPKDELPVQRSLHYMVGVQWRPAEGWMLDVEAYWRRTAGITEQYLWTDRFGQIQEFTFGNIMARTRGLDVTLHKDLGAYRGWINYSLSRVQHQDPTETLHQGNLYAASQDQAHELNLVQLYSLGNWNFSSTLVYGSGRPYTPPRELPTGVFTPANPNGVNTERLPPYFRLDLAVQWGFQWRALKGSLGCSLYNLTNYTNIQSRSYSFLVVDPDERSSPIQSEDDLVRRLTALDTKGLNFTPNFFLNLEL